MKVMCIYQGDCDDKTGEDYNSPLAEGSEYHVLESVNGPQGKYYRLFETESRICFHASLFAILPDQSADEINQEQKEAIVNLEQQLI